MKPLSAEEIADARHWFTERPAFLERSILLRLLDEVERSRALLKRIEWVHGDCPACGGGRPFFEPEPDEEPVSGHAADCELAALLPKDPKNG